MPLSRSSLLLPACLVVALTACRFDPDGSGQRSGGGGSDEDVCVETPTCAAFAASAARLNLLYSPGPHAVPPELTPPRGVTACGALEGRGITVYYEELGLNPEEVADQYRGQLLAAGYGLTHDSNHCRQSFSFEKAGSKGRFDQWPTFGTYAVQYGIP